MTTRPQPPRYRIRRTRSLKRRASWLAMLAGADFVKTSTGKVSPAATLPVTLVMVERIDREAGLLGRLSSSG